MVDRDAMVEVYAKHFPLIHSPFCSCGQFRLTSTEPGDRYHERGWSVSVDHTRKAYARHLADEYNSFVGGEK